MQSILSKNHSTKVELEFSVRSLASADYASVWNLQRALVEERAADNIPDTLLLVEHPAVITMGRKSTEFAQIEAQGLTEWQGVPLFCVERGGEATFHGPGQLVAYPIFKISQNLGARGFLKVLEQALIDCLATYGIDSYRREGATGVWLLDAKKQERKIASLGIALRHSVSYHGLALNISTELSFFQKIRPCGFAPDIMTSMQDLQGSAPAVFSVAEVLAKSLSNHSAEWR